MGMQIDLRGIIYVYILTTLTLSLRLKGNYSLLLGHLEYMSIYVYMCISKYHI